VTLAEAKNIEGFATQMYEDNDMKSLVMKAARHPEFSQYKQMAFVDPTIRASAADMLDRLFHGDGHAHQN
jgi:hypothetical protein